MNVLANAVTLALLHFVWQGVAVMAILWLLLAATRRSSPGTRYTACCAAMALLALFPIATTMFLLQPSTAGLAVAAAPTLMSSAAADALPAEASGNWLRWVLPVWAVGVLILSCRLVWNCHRVSKLRLVGASPDQSLLALIDDLRLRLGVARPIRVVVSTAAAVPGVLGWLRPVLLLPPATLAGLSVQQLETVLAHELAHVRRHDYLVNLLQRLVETLLFYHPAVWWTSARMRHERELCCDDVAVQTCGDPMGYARALAQLARIDASSPAMAATGGSLLHRVQRLVGVRVQESVTARWPAILASAAALACFGLLGNWAEAQPQPSPAPKTAPAPKPAAAAQQPRPVVAAKPKPTPVREAQREATNEFLEQRLADYAEELARAQENFARAEAEFAERRADLQRAQVDIERARVEIERAQEQMMKLQKLQRPATADPERQIRDRGSLAGVVSDPLGRPLVGATVRVRNLDTGAQYETLTGENGSYSFTQLQSGPYSATVTASGFAPFARERPTMIQSGEVHRSDFQFLGR